MSGEIRGIISIRNGDESSLFSTHLFDSPCRLKRDFRATIRVFLMEKDEEMEKSREEMEESRKIPVEKSSEMPVDVGRAFQN
ncbi:hypothetical protein L6452_27794 [Arctium lappa]|uniref:Uncharacterized protein n=1 Tax=Arctium lappa TaxID=4217 RepID=A0ACB8ZW87_ARCLA|nr:hypothetical protein L6452_27794 [Arctium lappa]